MEALINELINRAEKFGLNSADISNAKELLNNREYGVAFENLVTQLFEYEIVVDKAFYVTVKRIAEQMKIPDKNYTFLEELIR